MDTLQHGSLYPRKPDSSQTGCARNQNCFLDAQRDLQEPLYSEQWKTESVLPLPSPTLLVTVPSFRSRVQSTAHIILCHPSDSIGIHQNNTTRGGGQGLIPEMGSFAVAGWQSTRECWAGAVRVGGALDAGKAQIFQYALIVDELRYQHKVSVVDNYGQASVI